MMTRKKRRMIFIGIPTIIVLVIIGIIVFLYLNTDLFKSNQTLFFKYFSKNYDNINEIVELLKNDEYNNFIQDNKYSESSELKINYIENYGTTSENTQNAINKLKLTVNGETDKEHEYEYKEIELLNDNEKTVKIEYLKNNNDYGIKLSDLFKQYVVVNNNNLKNLFENMGYSEEQLQNIPEKIESSDYQDIKFSEEELEVLRKKYLNLIQEKISKDKISKKTNQSIIINEENFTTNAYSLTFTKEEFYNLFLSLLESLKEEEIILNKLDKMEEHIAFNISNVDTDDLKFKEIYVNYIKDIIEDINRTNIGTEEYTIIVYENNGDTIRTSLNTPDYEIDFDNTKIGEEKKSELIFKVKDKEVQKITLREKENKLELILKMDVNSNPVTLTIERNQTINNTKINSDTSIKYEDEKNKFEFDYVKRIELIDDLENMQEFNEGNSIELNGLESEQLVNILNKVKEGIDKELERITQNIKVEDFEKILKNIGIIDNKIVLENERCFRI